MPQNARIAASGGDYTTPQAWEAAEQGSNYGGAPTVGLVDGFFDFGAVELIIGGTTAFTNGSELRCFDTADGFDGTERQLCGFTTTDTRTVRVNTNSVARFVGLEIYCANTGIAAHPISTNGNASHEIEDCLIHTMGRKVTDPGLSFTNTVIVSERADTGFNLTGDSTFQNVSVFFDNSTNQFETNTASDVLDFDDTFIHNASAGGCFSGNSGVTQTNCGSTDATATAFPNIVIADDFVDSDPVGNGDYRIKAGGTLATNNIGAFIQVATGGVIPVIMNSYRQRRLY